VAVRKACNERGTRGARSRGEGKTGLGGKAAGGAAGTGSVDEAQVVELRVRSVCVWYDARPGSVVAREMIVVRVMARIARTKEAHPSKRPLQSARMVICSIAWGALAEPEEACDRTSQRHRQFKDGEAHRAWHRRRAASQARDRNFDLSGPEQHPLDINRPIEGSAGPMAWPRAVE
jgi:hypothetical protein